MKMKKNLLKLLKKTLIIKKKTKTATMKSIGLTFEKKQNLKSGDFAKKNRLNKGKNKKFQRK